LASGRSTGIEPKAPKALVHGTLSAITTLLNSPSLQILWRPEEAWDAVRNAVPTWHRSLFGLVAPLALLPAIAWPIGYGAVTFCLCVTTVCVVAAVIYALAPLFSTARQWDGAMAVAAYSSVPVFLASPLLAWATLTILVVVAFFHACMLCAVGLRRVLGCRDDAAMYVAAVGFVCGIAGLVLGGLSSAVGIL
jgi:hypothetical protein